MAERTVICKHCQDEFVTAAKGCQRYCEKLVCNLSRRGLTLADSYRLCDVETCENLHEAKGYCDKHYHIWKKCGDPLNLAWNERDRKCKVDKCLDETLALGFCRRHYRAYKNYGDPTVVKTRSINTDPYVCAKHGIQENPYVHNDGKYKHRSCRLCESWRSKVRNADPKVKARKAELSKLWRANNRQRSRDYYRNRRASRIEEARAYEREWWSKLEPEKAKAIRSHKNRLRKARIRGAKVRNLKTKEWAMILDAYYHSCAYCGAKGKITLDHWIPVSKRGDHTASNSVPSCSHCNSVKSDKVINFFPQPMLGLNEHPFRPRSLQE